jgi:NADH-quinone oxidoreductase E subunit
MAALYIAQEQNGFISTDVMKEVATLLDITAEDVLGVVTFYTMYHQKQMGKFHIQVCTNVSCMLRGGYDILKQIKDKIGIDDMGVTDDGLFSIEEVECMGSCGTAPMIAVNEDYYENLTKEKVDELLKSLSQTLS